MGWFGLIKSPERQPWKLRLRVNILPRGGATLLQASLPVEPGPVEVRLIALHWFPDDAWSEWRASLDVEVVDRLHQILATDYPNLLRSDPTNSFDGMSVGLAVQRGNEPPVCEWFQGWWGSPRDTTWRGLQSAQPAVRIAWEFFGLVLDGYDRPRAHTDFIAFDSDSDSRSEKP